MEKEKTYTKAEIYAVIDKAIKEAMENKNRYIQLNGYERSEALARHDVRIATLSFLYGKF